jgi:hypothetical protein
MRINPVKTLSLRFNTNVLAGLLALAPLCLGVLPSCASAPEDVESRTARLISADECLRASAGGKVGICHATSDANNPYVHIRVSVQACLHGHGEHEGDFISDDPSCPTATCTPIACPDLACGPMDDGCGGTVSCGDCSAYGNGWICAGTTCLPS